MPVSKRPLVRASASAPALAFVLLAGACSSTPPAPDVSRAAEQLAYEGDPSIAGEVRRSLDGTDASVCRVERPTGSHRTQRVCLSPEDDKRQRDMVQLLLNPARRRIGQEF